MVALNQNWISTQPRPTSAPIARQTPHQINVAPTTPNRLVLRARYYDPHTAEFISPDPLEYVDGMSLFRGYFVISSLDPNGRTSRRRQDQDGKLRPLKPLVNCDPAFRFASTPTEAPIDVPWSDTDLTIRPGVRAVGFTAVCFSVDCSCKDCSCDCGENLPGFLQELACDVTVNFHIFLDLTQIKVGGQDQGGRPIKMEELIDGTYGHEQRHVENYVRELKRALLLLKDQNAGAGCMDAENCRLKEDQLEEKIRKDFEHIKNMNAEHQYPEPVGGLTLYPVIGNRPGGQSDPSQCHLNSLKDAINNANKPR